MDIKKEYKKIFPETNWSDEEIISKMYVPKKKNLNEKEEKKDSINPQKLDITMDEFVKKNNGIYLDDLKNEYSTIIK